MQIVEGEGSGNSDRFYFLRLQNHCGWWLQPWIKRCLLPGRKAVTNQDSVLKRRDHFANKGFFSTIPSNKVIWYPPPKKNKGLYSQSNGFSSSHVWKWELDHKKGWEPKDSCFWTVTLEKTLESPLDCKEIKPVDLKGNQPWIFIGPTDTETEAPMLWPSDAKKWLTGKDPDAGRNWGQEEKGETVGWHHWHNGHEFEQTLENSKEQKSLGRCGPWGCKELDVTAAELQQQGLCHLLKIKS